VTLLSFPLHPSLCLPPSCSGTPPFLSPRPSTIRIPEAEVVTQSILASGDPFFIDPRLFVSLSFFIAPRLSFVLLHLTNKEKKKRIKLQKDHFNNLQQGRIFTRGGSY
jgi:hypothetical protein